MFSSLVAMMVAGVMSAQGGTSGTIRGDYVEVRTASVFAGACHYNGEAVTTGQEAVMAWKVTGGSWKGTDLAGVKAAAAVVSDLNLGDEHGARKTELVIDSAATDSQAKAFAEVIEAKFHDSLGTLVSVKRGAVNFTKDENGKYTVDAAKFVSCSVEPMPDAGCCKQPNLVWYSPLVPLVNRKVGFTDDAAYEAETLGSRWARSGENSAFYGMFSF